MDDRTFAELERAIDQIWAIAQRLGLDPFPVHFEVVPAEVMYEIGAYGLPGRFSHWTHGRAYHHQKTLYDYGLTKIYELVINSNPAYAFLLDSNSLLQNKLVVAHVLAHVDFFKHNAYFEHTNRQMIDTVAVNAERIRRYEFQHGRLEVERFLDAVLSIQEHVDPHVRFRRQPTPPPKPRSAPPAPYDDLLSLTDPPATSEPGPTKFPPEPEKDLLLFIAEHARHLADWQRDVILIVRQEMLYFIPQLQTKILNEGWASYWHARILRELPLSDDEAVEFARMHAAILAPTKHHLNPYYVGLKILEDIERRWDHPAEEECLVLGRQPGQGRAKLFEVRTLENDVSLIRNYLTRDLVEEMGLYIYKVEGDQLKVVETDWEKVRDLIVRSMTNFGNPYIVVEDGDYRRNGELYLKHIYEGQELDIAYAERTLQYVYQLWGRPVHLETVLNEKPVLLSYDGEKNTRKNL